METGIFRPSVPGGAFVAFSSDDLATMDINGIAEGTICWNDSVGEYFKLTKVNRTEITLDPSDNYNSPTWTFANAAFTGKEGCSLAISLNGANSIFSKVYVIDTVGGATEVNVINPPDGATSGVIAGIVFLYDDALVTDEVIEANGNLGFRWIKETIILPSNSVSRSMLDSNLRASIPGPWNQVTISAATSDVTISGLDGNTAGGFEIRIYAKAANGSGVHTVWLKPNNLDTNQEGVSITQRHDTTTPTGTAEVFMKIGTLAENGGDLSAIVLLKNSKTGSRRFFHSEAYTRTAPTVFPGFQCICDVNWDDTTNNITSLVIHSDGTNNIDTTSVILWRTLNQPGL